MNIVIHSKVEKQLRDKLKNRQDVESQRIRRYLSMPDLSRTPGSPIYELVNRIIKLPDFSNFDVLDVPEIVSSEVSFDLFDFPANHPARSKTDTYYVDEKTVLRTHTTIMWYYYLLDEKIKQKIQKQESVGSLSYGKVYRKDEIDRQHMNIFHHMDGWYLIPKQQKIVTV